LSSSYPRKANAREMLRKLHKRLGLPVNEKSCKETPTSLDRATLKDILDGVNSLKGDVLAIDFNATMSEAMEQLAEWNLLAAPVVMRKGSVPHDENRAIDNKKLDISFPNCLYTPVGFVDVRALLGTFITIAMQELARGHIHDLAHMEEPLFKAATRVANMKVVNALGEDGGMLRIKREDGELDVTLRELVDNSLSVHGGVVHYRLAITDFRGHLQHVLSQADIVQFLYKHPECIGAVAHSTIAAVSIGSCDVFTISEDLPALFALAALHKHNRPAAALVSSTKQLVGAISMSDVRGLTPKECSQLSMPVGKFLTQFKQQLPIYRIAPDATQSRSKTKSKPIVALKTFLKSKSFKSSSKKKAEDDSISRDQSDGLEKLILSMRCTSLPTSTARHPAAQRPHRSTRRSLLQSPPGAAASGIDPRTNLSPHRNARTHTLKTEHAHAIRSSCEGCCKAPLCCTPQNTILDVFQALVDHHAQLMFVIDEKQQPILTITLTDVLRLVGSRSPRVSGVTESESA